MLELTEIQMFKVSKNQKKTLKLLHKKYRINTSEYIRKAITEQLKRDKETIFKNYKEIQMFINQYNDIPF